MKLLCKVSAALMLTTALACSTMSPVLLPTGGAMLRQVTRVLERHDDYVNADTTLTMVDRETYLGQSTQVVATMAAYPDGITSAMLSPFLAPVMDRHDAYVSVDSKLDPIELQQYLATTSGLRSLLTKARWDK